MKKIDLHIHTVPTISESTFTFSLDTFCRYVREAKLDAVAVTNHDMFDGQQFRTIRDALDSVVFPGIEINVEKGHLLLIADPSGLDEFETKARLVSTKIARVGDCISISELTEIFGDLSKYLLIPHYDKKPSLTSDSIEKLRSHIYAGEVDSAKKFVRTSKDESKLTPVLFSDARMKVDLDRLPNRQTFVDCGTLTVSALKASLRDRKKVALSERDGNRLWQVLENGQKISTGLNVLLGARSSGKTHTLDKISSSIESFKYIKQFSLVQQSEADSEREFKGAVDKRKSVFADEYLSGLKRVLDDVMNVDLVANDRKVDRYLETLLKSAEEIDRRDAFSKAALFDEVDFPVGATPTLIQLIASVKQIIENIEFRALIQKHVNLMSLKRLACELIELLWERTLESEKKKFVNSLVREVKAGLKIRTSAIQIEDVDLYAFALDNKRIERFVEVVGFLKSEAVIFEESIQGFRVEARRQMFQGAGELRAVSGVRTSFADAFRHYSEPYEYLRHLLANESLARSELYKFFVKIVYRILNKDGFEVSGGERSEYRLLQEISDAQNFDILLIDEPESSFDNLFLNSNVNQILKAISESMPVVVVTHSSTVGASVGADYLLHTRKEIEEGIPIYRIYSGYPTDKKLISVDGKEIDSHECVMDSLEAGAATYEIRRQGYEAIRN